MINKLLARIGYKTIICLIYAIGSFTSASAQEMTSLRRDTTAVRDNSQHVQASVVEIVGKVVDENNLPKAYATLFISAPQAPKVYLKGALTANDGTFSIVTPPGDYILTASFLGYKTVTARLSADEPVTDAGVMTLKQTAMGIEEITVRPIIEINPREVIYNITSDPDRETSSMLDILGKMPLISFDFEGKPIVAENESYIVLRNGRRDPLLDSSVPLYEMLRRLPAMGFTKITITSSPPARFSKFKYAINITADKTKRLFGALGGSEAGYDMGSGTLSANQTVTGSADKLRFSAGAGYQHLSQPERSHLSTLESHDSQTLQELESTTHVDGNIINGRLNLSQDLTEKQFMGVMFNFERDSRKTVEESYTREIANGAEQGMATTSFTRRSQNLKYNGRVNYELEFKKPTRILSFFYTLTHDNDNNDELKSSLALDGSVLSRLVSEHPEDKTDHYISIDYSDLFWGDKLTFNVMAGYMMSDFKQRASYYETSQGAAVEEQDQYRFFERSLRRFDGTAKFSFLTANKLHIQGTARWDYFLPSTRTTTISGTALPQDVDESGMAISAGVEAVYFLADLSALGSRMSSMMRIPHMMQSNFNSISLSYNFSQRRPTAIQLTNYVEESNPLYLTTGNPNLKNERFHAFGISYRNRVVSPTITYTFSPNRITRYWERNAEGQLVESFANAAKSQNLVVNMGKSIRLSSSVVTAERLNLSVSGGYSKADTYENISENFNLLLQAGYSRRLFSQLSLRAGLMYRQNWASGYSGSSYGSPLTGNIQLYGFVNLSPKTRLSYRVSVENIGSWKNRMTTFVDSDDFTRKSTMINKSTPISFSINILFGKFDVKEVRKTKGRSEIEGFSKPE